MKVLYFGGGLLLGGAIGFLVSAKVLDKKYKAISDKEIASVKEAFSKPAGPTYAIINELEESAKKANKPMADLADTITKAAPTDRIRYDKMYKGDTKYPSEATVVAPEEVDESMTEEDSGYEESKVILHMLPYSVPPDEFGDEEGFESLTFTLFADGILTDDAYHQLSKDEIRKSVGSGYHAHMGEFEVGIATIKNDERQCYYEIVTSEQTYRDYLSENRPHMTSKYDED